MSDREPSHQQPDPPRMVVGWKCGHIGVTAGPHVDLADYPASCGFGCTMRPQYRGAA